MIVQYSKTTASTWNPLLLTALHFKDAKGKALLSYKADGSKTEGTYWKKTAEDGKRLVP